MNKVVAIQLEKEYEKKSIKMAYEQLIHEFGMFNQIFKKGDRVLVKPNLVAPSEKATTDLYLLECVLKSLLQIGTEPIVAESSGFEFSTEATFHILGVDRLCQQLGVRLVNLDLEKFREVPSGNKEVPLYKLPELVFNVDKIINIPRLKGHSLTKVTFSIKNLFGLLHKETRRRIHATNLQEGIKYLKKIISIDFIIVDGLWNLINAVYSAPEYQGIILAGNDMTAVDYCCCSILGIDYKDILHIYDCREIVEYEYKELSKIECGKFDLKSREEHFKKQNKRYKILYRLDLLFAKISKQTLIPYMHYFLGIRPYINKRICNSCGECEKVCPLGAISNRSISHKKCMKARCLKCFDICPVGAIEKKGFHK